MSSTRKRVSIRETHDKCPVFSTNPRRVPSTPGNDFGCRNETTHPPRYLAGCQEFSDPLPVAKIDRSDDELRQTADDLPRACQISLREPAPPRSRLRELASSGSQSPGVPIFVNLSDLDSRLHYPQDKMPSLWTSNDPEVIPCSAG